jgi:hypothetical protein
MSQAPKEKLHCPKCGSPDFTVTKYVRDGVHGELHECHTSCAYLVAWRKDETNVART